MPATILTSAALVLLTMPSIAQSERIERDLSTFMGRALKTIEPEHDPEHDPEGFFPKAPVAVCLEGPPQRQCYTAPKGMGRVHGAIAVHLDEKTPALLFSAANLGVSGFSVHYALLRPGVGKDLDDLFPSDVTVSNQSQYAFWRVPAISETPIFVTADYHWGPSDEGHYGEHRYMISTYVSVGSLRTGDLRYFLEDRYMTARKYDLDKNAQILVSERQEILTRLRQRSP